MTKQKHPLTPYLSGDDIGLHPRAALALVRDRIEEDFSTEPPTKQQHTPTPWTNISETKARSGPRPMALVATPGGRMAIDATGSGKTSAEDLANAAFIVRAVNSHEQLVEALQHTRQFILAWIPEYQSKRDRDSLKQMQRIEAALGQVDAALSKAKVSP